MCWALNGGGAFSKSLSSFDPFSATMRPLQVILKGGGGGWWPREEKVIKPLSRVKPHLGVGVGSVLETGH